MMLQLNSLTVMLSDHLKATSSCQGHCTLPHHGLCRTTSPWQEQKQRQEKLLAEEIEAEKQHPDQHKDVATLLHKTSSGTGSPTQQVRT